MHSDLQRSFATYDRMVRIQNSKLGAILAMILMPAGVMLDYFVYTNKTLVLEFLGLRLLCSLLVFVVWFLLRTKFGQEHYRVLGMTWYMLPALFISAMIYSSHDPISPYYAGLNIVLLGVGLILPWTYQENLLAGSLVIVMYLVAYLGGTPQIRNDYLFNNLYFLLLTTTIVVVGSFFHSKLRFREFELRFELDQSKRMIEESHQKLVDLDRAKSRFFANISHELRTPLTLVIAPLELLQQRFARSGDGEVNDMLRTMQTNGLRLLKLINNLLDLVKLESGKVEVSRDVVAVPEFLQGLVNSVKEAAREKAIQLECHVADGITVALIDRDKLEKIVLNLMFNAIKFTPAGGKVALSCRVEEQRIAISVQDNGIGISETDLPKIFDRFWQVDGSAKRKYQGTGIGLSLVKELAEVQNGSVEAISVVGGGTTLTLRLPYAPAPSRPETSTYVSVPAIPNVNQAEWLDQLYRRAEFLPAPVIAEPGASDFVIRSDRPSILVADDEPDMLQFLKSQLSLQFQVIEAVDGQEAVEKARQYLPHLLLLDLMMPEKDGLQVCRELRQQTSTQNLPIILLTAHADEEAKLAALSSGANDFLSKPFSSTELHVRVRNLIETFSAQKKLERQKQILEATLDELKETEMQLIQSEKLASLGRMSAGIIHEINNPLNYIKTALHVLKGKKASLELDAQSDFDEILTDVEEGINRVRNIVNDLRTFTQGKPGIIEQVKIGKAVSQAVKLVSRGVHQNIEISNRIPETVEVAANTNQVIQILINIFQNALDAMEGKKFETENPKLDISLVSTMEWHEVHILDNGPGIDPGLVDKVFDPFFTTKDVGKGMGLGLSICYRLMQQWKGRIDINTKKGQYCELILKFPLNSAS